MTREKKKFTGFVVSKKKAFVSWRPDLMASTPASETDPSGDQKLREASDDFDVKRLLYGVPDSR